jgi:hypothetical protein
MQIRTAGKIAVFCFGAAMPFMAAGQAHAAQRAEVTANANAATAAVAVQQAESRCLVDGISLFGGFVSGRIC